MSTVDFTASELEALKKEHAANATDEQFKLWIAECRSRNLAPVRDIIMQVRTSEEWDPEVKAKVKRKKSIYIVTIGAKRKIANATGLYAGQLPTKWIYLDKENQPTVESEIPLPDPKNPKLPLEPWAVRTAVLRKGFDAPLTVVSRFGAYCQTIKRDDKVMPTAIWSAHGRSAEMLEKCSESACLTRAFPSELSGLYIQEELQKDDVLDSIPVAAEATVAVVEAPKPPEVPQINHTPAAPTTEPRPKEDKPKVKKTAKETKIEEVINQKVEIVDEPVVTAPEPVQKMETPKKTSAERLRALMAAGLAQNALRDYLIAQTGAAKPADIPADKLSLLIDILEAMSIEDAKLELTKKPEKVEEEF